jgi:AhpD family alkylhydroperoxidase
MLERFLFPGNQQYAPINKLSGGEKRRLFLLRILISAPNVLILDEPTNDLDVQTLAVLEDYLEDFNGCVIVVSHDRYFLDRTVDRIFALEEGGGLRQYPGNYSIYLDYKKAEEAEKQEPSKTVIVESKGVSPVAETKKARRLSNWERREFEELEQKIAKLETEKTAALTAAALMAQNNTWYPYTEMVEGNLKGISPQLRMNAIATHGGTTKLKFESYSLAASIIGKCEACVKAHFNTLKNEGYTTENLRDIGRIAATIAAVAKLLP